MADIVGPKTLASYRDGTMPPERRRQFEALLADGTLVLPEGESLDVSSAGPSRRENGEKEPSLFDRAKDFVTGESRRTATTEAASDITLSPEWVAVQQAGLAGPVPAEGETSPGAIIKRAALTGVDALTGGIAGAVQRAGKMAASPAEQFQMILDANPDIKPEVDEKGNRFFRSANGQVFSEQPGLRVTDIPRIAANVGAFAGAGAATTIPRAVLAGVATQSALEGGQAAAGGDFDAGEVAIAGGLQALGPAVGALRSAKAAKPVVRAADEATDVAAAVVKGAPVDDVKLADIAKRAAEGSPAAKQQLAELMAVDKGAVDAAKRLGIELPADVLSESDQIRSVFGGVRGKVGSEAEAAWAKTVKEAADRADEVIQQFDGAPSPAAVSDKVLGSLQASRDALKQEAKTLYQAVDDVIKPSAPVTMENVDEVLRKSLADLDGDVSALSDGERMLLKLAERSRVRPDLPAAQGRATQEALKRTKAELQRAVRAGEGAFASNDQRRLQMLERALKADELANAERIGGADLREKVRAAHQMTARQKGLEARMIGAFGKDLEGSAAALMQGAIADASKGNAARLAKLLKAVPEDLHGEVLMTALSSSTRAKGGGVSGGFGFSEFAKVYAGLRQKGNEQVYAKIAKALGPERERALRDLYEVSKRITDARAAVKTTGKANQPFMAALEAESLVQKIAGSSLGKAAALGAGGAGGGGLGAVGASALLNAIAKGDKDVVQKVGKLLVSPEFQALAIEAATKPRVSQTAVKRVARGRFWREFAKAAKLPRDPASAEKWIMAALQAGRQERPQ